MTSASQDGTPPEESAGAGEPEEPAAEDADGTNQPRTRTGWHGSRDHTPDDVPDVARGGVRDGVRDGVRFALGTLTVLPVHVHRWDRDAARNGMAWAPLAGLLLGLAAAVGGGAALVPGGSTLLAAVLTVAVPAVLTRGLHLDGLADVADGLGSGRPAHEALGVMKRSDIGPFGVLALLFVVLGQIAVVDQLYGQGGWICGSAAVTVAAVTARTTLTLAARPTIPAARPEGLGAVVAGTVPARTGMAVTAAVLALSALLGCGALGWTSAVATGAAGGQVAVAYEGLVGVVRVLVAGAAGLLAAELLLRHCRRRLGGVTGDVFGALAETAATTTLVVLALT